MAIEASSVSRGEVIRAEGDQPAVRRYDRYAAASEPLHIEIVSILEGHGRYGEALRSDLLEKEVQIKGAVKVDYLWTVLATAGTFLSCNLFTEERRGWRHSPAA